MGRLFALLLIVHNFVILIPLLLLGIVSEMGRLHFITGEGYIWVEMELLSSISTVAPVGSSVGALYLKLYIQSKGTPEDGRIFCPKNVGLI